MNTENSSTSECNNFFCEFTDKKTWQEFTDLKIQLKILH